MPDRILTLRELNRATLHRQMLLERETLPVPAAIERLVGLQAQALQPPYISLWTRLRDFRREDLIGLIHSREIIKASFLRATLHLVTAEDYLRFRAALQPALARAWSGIAKQRGADFDFDRLLAGAERFIAEKPRTFAEITKWIEERYPGQDVGVMRYAVRTHLPLVQVPVDSAWSYAANPAFTLAEGWIDRPIATQDHLRELVIRYLAAFGPASVTDMQTWSGLPKLKDTFDRLKPELQTYRDENRRELFDLPEPMLKATLTAPLPSSETPAPIRYLPEFDNLLLSHSSRARVIADEHRAKVFLPGLRVRATILVDGFVRGAWKIEKTKTAAELVIEPFEPLARPDQEALVEEGERLVRFIEPEAKTHAVRITA